MRKRRRTKPGEPTGVHDILNELRSTTDLGHQLEQARIWEEWPFIAGEHLHGHGRPSGIREQTLLIEADSAVWMHKFAYHKWHILKRINMLAGRELVSDLFISLRSDDNTTR